MSLDWFEDVLEFHRKFVPERIGKAPGRCPPGREKLVNDLVAEEFQELLDAGGTADLVETADATIDLIYVLLGRLIAFGVDARPEIGRAHV